MLCRDVISRIERRYPREYALDWDNVGLLAGRDDKEVRRIYIALDATDEVIEDAVNRRADMLITHHPLIFGALKCVNNLDFIGRRLLALIENNISYYAMHTNYDVMGMADLAGEKMEMTDAKVLDITSDSEKPEGIGRIADLKEAVTLTECCETVKQKFHLNSVKVFGDMSHPVQRIAISPGSGKSMIPPALNKKADVLITGDIDHHSGIDAVAQGLSIIDAGHYGIEHIFVEDLKTYLAGELGGIEVLAAPVSHPFVNI